MQEWNLKIIPSSLSPYQIPEFPLVPACQVPASLYLQTFSDHYLLTTSRGNLLHSCTALLGALVQDQWGASVKGNVLGSAWCQTQRTPRMRAPSAARGPEKESLGHQPRHILYISCPIPALFPKSPVLTAHGQSLDLVPCSVSPSSSPSSSILLRLLPHLHGHHPAFLPSQSKGQWLLN